MMIGFHVIFDLYFRLANRFTRCYPIPWH